MKKYKIWSKTIMILLIITFNLKGQIMHQHWDKLFKIIYQIQMLPFKYKIIL
jgi:hypothetical protein